MVLREERRVGSQQRQLPPWRMVVPGKMAARYRRARYRAIRNRAAAWLKRNAVMPRSEHGTDKVLNTVPPEQRL